MRTLLALMVLVSIALPANAQRFRQNYGRPPQIESSRPPADNIQRADEPETPVVSDEGEILQLAAPEIKDTKTESPKPPSPAEALVSKLKGETSKPKTTATNELHLLLPDSSKIQREIRHEDMRKVNAANFSVPADAELPPAKT